MIETELERERDREIDREGERQIEKKDIGRGEGYIEREEGKEK